jgi:hypothetical protein
MNLDDIRDLIADGRHFRFAEAQFEVYEGELCVNGLVPVPLTGVSGSYGVPAGGQVVDIVLLDEQQNRLGVLCLCRDLGEIDLTTITDAQYAAYLHAVPSAEYELPYHFSADYVVLDQARFIEYRDHYLTSSAIWGGFLHASAPLIATYKHLPVAISAVRDLRFPTPFHEENSKRSVAEPYAFERFLKLYHLFELLFDWDLVQRIQQLGNDLLGVGKLLAEYERNELDRLKDILSVRCTDYDPICSCLEAVGNYRPTAKLMFFTYGKGGNAFPGQDGEKKFDALLDLGAFTEANARAAKVQGVNSTETFQRFAIHCAAYWVYRVRCSIAHNRIGEYVITSADEEFIVQFAEPLIRELLTQALK